MAGGSPGSAVLLLERPTRGRVHARALPRFQVRVLLSKGRAARCARLAVSSLQELLGPQGFIVALGGAWGRGGRRPSLHPQPHGSIRQSWGNSTTQGSLGRTGLLVQGWDCLLATDRKMRMLCVHVAGGVTRWGCQLGTGEAEGLHSELEMRLSEDEGTPVRTGQSPSLWKRAGRPSSVPAGSLAQPHRVPECLRGHLGY